MVAINTSLSASAEIVYTTKDGDVLDEILSKHYRTTGIRLTLIVLKANPGLAGLGAVYQSGVKITLPVIANSLIVPIARPWGKLS